MKKNIFKILLTLFVIYSAYITPKGELSRNLAVTVNLVEYHTFDIDRFNPDGIDKFFYRNHYYVPVTPGISMLLAAPYVFFKYIYKFIPIYFLQNYPQRFFLLLNYFLDFLLAIIPSIFLAIVLYKFLKSIFKNQTYGINFFIIAFFLATPYFFYAVQVREETYSMLIYMLCFMSLYLTRDKHNRMMLFGMGLLCGSLILVHYYNIILSLALLFYAICLHRKNILTFFSGYIMPFILLLGYQKLIYGNFFTMPLFLKNEAGGALVKPYLHSLLPADIALAEQGRKFYLPSLKIAFLLLFSFEKGLFLHMPLAIMCLWGGAKALVSRQTENRLELLMCIILFLVYLLLNAAVDIDWQGGSSNFWGPRYLMPIIPSLFLMLVFSINTINKKMLYFFFTISIFINWIGVQYGSRPTWIRSITEFICKGPSFPVLEWAKLYLYNYTQYHPSISNLGLLILLAFLIYIIWHNNFLINKFNADKDA